MRFTLITILIFSFAGLLMDTWFVSIKPFITTILSVIMFFMGSTLKSKDFKRIIQNWKLVVLGTSLQFLAMPLLAFLISNILNLSPPITLGMMLVGVCPGGTASNVIVFLGKGNVALSVSLTLFSTLLSPLLTPLLLELCLSQSIEVNTLGMFISIAQIVISPLILGACINHFLPKVSKHIQSIASESSSIGIALIIASVIALNKKMLVDFPFLVFFAVATHNLLGFAIGYLSSSIFTKDSSIKRTIAIEVGMQNSGLAVGLAQAFFSTQSLATLPGAIFSLWHNLSGITFTSLFTAKKTVKQ